MISMFSNKIKINYGLSIIEKKVGDVSVLYTNQTSNGSYNVAVSFIDGGNRRTRTD
jgi:hypothetical protein